MCESKLKAAESDVQLPSCESRAQSEAPGAAGTLVVTDFDVLSVEETFLSVTCRLSSEDLTRGI